MPLYWATDWTDETGITTSASNSTYTASSFDWCDDYSVTSTASTTSSWAYVYDRARRTIVTRNANDRWWLLARDWLDQQQRRDVWLEREWLERRDMQQIRADRAALEQQRRVIAEHVDTAQSKAMALLMKNLSPEQQETLRQHKWFIVEGGHTGRRYRIRDRGNMVANIDVLNGETVEHRLCGHCDPREVPLADNLLAQKLMLEGDEEAFLRIANRHAA